MIRTQHLFNKYYVIIKKKNVNKTQKSILNLIAEKEEKKKSKKH